MMLRFFAIAVLMLASCAVPVEHGGIDERLLFWKSDVKRFLHMHRSESELRNWLDRRSIEYSIPAPGLGFVALLESVHEADQSCSTDIYLVGDIKDANVLWYRVEAIKGSDCEDSLAT